MIPELQLVQKVASHPSIVELYSVQVKCLEPSHVGLQLCQIKQGALQGVLPVQGDQQHLQARPPGQNRHCVPSLVERPHSSYEEWGANPQPFRCCCAGALLLGLCSLEQFCPPTRHTSQCETLSLSRASESASQQSVDLQLMDRLPQHNPLS